MITVIVRYVVKKEKTDDFIVNVKKLVEATGKEKGCVFYECCRNDDDPLKFMMMERWESKEALDAHSASPHFKEYVPKIELALDEKAMDKYSAL